MLTLLTFTNIALLTSITALLLFFTTFIKRPLQRISSLKQEGVITYFFPILGFLKYEQNSFNRTGDIGASSKESSKVYPNQKLFVTNWNNKALLMLRSTQYAKEFLQKQNYYEKADIFKTIQPLIGSGLVSAEGDVWKRHRKIISSSFNYDFLKKNIPVIQETTKEFLQNLHSDEYKNYSVISKVQEITGETVGRIFFGKNLSSYSFEGKPLTLALADLTTSIFSLIRTIPVVLFGHKIMKMPFLPKYKREMQRIEDFRSLCLTIIQDRKVQQQRQENNDLLSSLLATQKSEDPEKRFSDSDIVDEFITFFIAGMDTTGHLVGMTLYNLTQYPKYLETLKEERHITYNIESNVSADTLHKMDLLHSVLKETLRFYSPASFLFFRKAIADHNIGDLNIQKGELVTIDLTALSFDEKNFERPDEFDPLRWRNPEQKLDPYGFIPFSSGARNCIGQHLAIMEAKIIISEFLERFDFRLKDGYELKMTRRFLYEPDKELFFDLYPKIG